MSQWHAIVIDGSEAAVRGFVSGFVGDRGADPTRVVIGKDVGAQAECLGQRILDLLTGDGHQLVLVTDDLHTPLLDALTRGGAAAHLELAEQHPVRGASFHFTVETFSREVAAQVQAVLQSPAPGAAVTNESEETETDPEAKGLEMFAPEHEFTYRAQADVTGPVDAVIATRQRLADIEAVQLDPLQLEQ